MTRTITLILLLGLLSCCSSGKDDDARKGGGSKPDPDAVGLTLSQQSKTIPENIFGYNTQSIKGPGWDKAEFISGLRNSIRAISAIREELSAISGTGVRAITTRSEKR